MTPGSAQTIAERTGELYAAIWDEFSAAQWQQFADDHFFKWMHLPIQEDFFQGKVCLDAGCGSGRATRSLFALGAEKVYAIDVGSGCVRNTLERNRDRAERLEAGQASVLALPYADESFDFVFCDGVLHHTTAPEQGFSELVRVLKPGGKIVVGVYGRGGLLNLAIYSARLFRPIIPQRLTLFLCKLASRNPVFWYVILDSMYVPIRRDYHEREIQAWFEKAALQNMVRTDSTWGPYAHGRWMKGEGYIRVVANKPA